MKDFKIIDEPTRGKVGVLVGTRPGIIKMSSIIKELDGRRSNYFVIHAGQHYSFNMDRIFFDDLQIPEPKYRLEEVKNYSLHGEQTAVMLKGIERILVEEKPELLLVCGDANFNLAGALAARKLRLKVGHVEAGLRSYDWRMPEEHNRVIIDHISEYLFATSEKAKQTALEDNIRGEVFVTGSTIVDAISDIRRIGTNNGSPIKELGLKPDKYCLLTSHREENVDTKDFLKGILNVVERIIAEYGMPVVYPMHPRTIKRLEQFDLTDKAKKIKELILIEPLGYVDCISLLSQSKLALTDSGGLQQEACILGVPCVTLRPETEWIETVEVGANFIGSVEPENIMRAVAEALKADRDWVNPFGGIGAAKLTVDIVEGLVTGR